MGNDKSTIARLRDEIKEKENTPMSISVKTTRGRKIYIDGVIYGAYPNVFVMSVKDRETVRQMSFNYCDIISGKVKVLARTD